MRTLTLAAGLLLWVTHPASAQSGTFTPTHADSVRGSNGPARSWFDVTFYDLHVRVSPSDSSVSGYNRITYRVSRPAQAMQLDLQPPLVLDSVVQGGRALVTRREGDAYAVMLATPQQEGAVLTATAFYHGQPGRGRSSPWSSGFVWARDSLGGPWIATTNELSGASIWWPLKDYAGDEPDSQRIAITVPDPMVEVSNGILRSTSHNRDGTTTYEWFVSNPINAYNVAVNAGRYTHFTEAFEGEKGRLSLDFWPLAAHLDTARAQWRQTASVLRCYEHWFGPYPWYADGYKLIEAPYLGMEHQSAIAYGNRFLPGYLGRDLSGTGLGLGWDYIVVHETAHEWFGNNITTREPGDLWVHEAFATYAEGLYIECQHGPGAGGAYLVGLRRAIRNVEPMAGPRGVARWYNQDMYHKGANLLLTIRQLVDDDAKWRSILRGLNQTFWHRTVTGQDVEDYISRRTGLDLSKVFQQYLTTTQIPEFDYRIEPGTLFYRWSNVVPGFAMPVRVQIPGLGTRWLQATQTWQHLPARLSQADEIQVDEDFYVTRKNVRGASPAQER